MASWWFIATSVFIISSLIFIAEAKKPGRCKPCGINEKRTKCPTCEFSCDQRDRMCAAVVKCQTKSVCQCLAGHFRNNGICVPETQCPKETPKTAPPLPPASVSETTISPTNEDGFIIVHQKEHRDHYEHIDLMQKTSPKLEDALPKTEKPTNLPEDYGLIVISEKVSNRKTQEED